MTSALAIGVMGASSGWLAWQPMREELEYAEWLAAQPELLRTTGRFEGETPAIGLASFEIGGACSITVVHDGFEIMRRCITFSREIEGDLIHFDLRRRHNDDQWLCMTARSIPAGEGAVFGALTITSSPSDAFLWIQRREACPSRNR